MSADDQIHPVEFHLSDRLYEETVEIADSNGLTLDELAIASVGMLNEARRIRFQTAKTMLINDEQDLFPLPPLNGIKEEIYPNHFTVALKPHLFNPMQEYVLGRQKVDLLERARRAIRFGTFVLSHVTVYEGEEVLFRHHGSDVGILYRTQQ